MNYNANTPNPGGRPSLGRKMNKRVSFGSSYPPTQPPFDQQPPPFDQPPIYPSLATEAPNPAAFQPGYGPAPVYGAPTAPVYGFDPPAGFNGAPVGGGPSLSVFGQPMVQDMAMQYGQQLANTGKTMFKQEVEKYVPVSSLKYYFAVDNKYVISKLALLFFPFTHKDWSVRYQQDKPIQPRFEVNVPDLYIPTMAYVTYVLVAGVLLGMQQRFSPEQIGIIASSALAWTVVEIAVYKCALYVANIETTLRALDLLAFSGYKFVGMIPIAMAGCLRAAAAYYGALAYVNLALAFFLLRTLKVHILASSGAPSRYYGESATYGNKRRSYFLLFVAGVQPVLSWWLTYHLIGAEAIAAVPLTPAVAA